MPRSRFPKPFDSRLRLKSLCLTMLLVEKGTTAIPNRTPKVCEIMAFKRANIRGLGRLFSIFLACR